MTTAVALKLEEWISVGAAARILKKSARQVNNYIENGLLRSRRLGKSGWKEVNSADVEKMMEVRRGKDKD